MPSITLSSFLTQVSTSHILHQFNHTCFYVISRTLNQLPAIVWFYFSSAVFCCFFFHNLSNQIPILIIVTISTFRSIVNRLYYNSLRSLISPFSRDSKTKIEFKNLTPYYYLQYSRTLRLSDSQTLNPLASLVSHHIFPSLLSPLFPFRCQSSSTVASLISVFLHLL
jgi:hypothetical protein